MPITHGSGSVLRAEAEALVNTVNTVGVMGKGIALQFRQAFPANYRAYRAACGTGEVRLGEMFVVDTGRLGAGRFIVNCPTKGHWRGASRLADIETGLIDLVRVLTDLGVRSVAVPALGCGNGGLDWSVVRPLIENALSPLDAVDVQLFPPAGASDAADMPVATAQPPMNLGRAVLVRLVEEYHRLATLAQGTVSEQGAALLELQKLMYLAQVAGQDLRLTFSKRPYGPYAEALNNQLQSMEGHYTRGYGDRSDRVLALKPIRLLPGATELAASVLDEQPEVLQRLDQVWRLLAGFESPYGLELLTTVHWAVRSGQARDAEEATRVVQGWNARKARLFQPHHVRTAYAQLDEQAWLEERAA